MNVSRDLVDAIGLSDAELREQFASAAQRSMQAEDNAYMDTPDYRSAEDYERAMDILRDVPEDIGPVGLTWRQHAAVAVGTKLDRYFRDRVPLRTEQLAHAEIKRIALLVQDASEALLSCAERMRSKGDRTGAADAFRAYQRFSREAQALLGGDV
jgi:hypothetical protein